MQKGKPCKIERRKRVKITEIPSGTPLQVPSHICISMSACRCLIEKSLTNRKTCQNPRKTLTKRKTCQNPGKAKLKKENVAKSQKPPLALPPTSPKSYLHIHVCMSMSHRNIICQSENLSKSWEKSPTKRKTCQNPRKCKIERGKRTKITENPSGTPLQVPSHICISMSACPCLIEKSLTNRKTCQNPRKITYKQENLSKSSKLQN